MFAVLALIFFVFKAIFFFIIFMPMKFDWNFEYELALRLLISFLVGAAIGFEREYRGKAAGLRTMIMICVGSTIFTEISISIPGTSTDRVASNIVTGIGFLGAGVIFKDGLTINGITTATTIWMCAALGMAIGIGEYFVALTGSGIVLLVLTLFESVKDLVSRWHQVRIYHLSCDRNDSIDNEIETEIKRLGLHCEKHKDIRNRDERRLSYTVSGKEQKMGELDTFLRNHRQVLAYEY